MKRVAGIGIAALLLLLGGWGVLKWRANPPGGLGARTLWVENGPALPPFSLQSTRGPLTLENLKGHWTLLLFGYTHCPDVCPTDLALLAQVEGRLAAQHRTPPAVVFVSVDPARDSVAVLARYVPAFDPDFIAATGDDAALEPFKQSIGMYYVRHAPEPGEAGGYTVDHSSAVYLVDPQGRVPATFQMPMPVPALVHDLEAILER